MSEEISNREIEILITINHGDGFCQRVHTRLPVLDKNDQDVGAQSLLQLTDDLGRLSGLLKDNQHFQLVERDEP